MKPKRGKDWYREMTKVSSPDGQFLTRWYWTGQFYLEKKHLDTPEIYINKYGFYNILPIYPTFDGGIVFNSRGKYTIGFGRNVEEAIKDFLCRLEHFRTEKRRRER